MESTSLFHWIVLLLVGLAVWCGLRARRSEATANVLRSNPDRSTSKMSGGDRFPVRVVGGSRYRKSFKRLQQRHRLYGIDQTHYCEAVLSLEDENPYDDQAVGVAIDGLKIGYLSRQMARVLRAELRHCGHAGLRQIATEARINRGDGDADFSVKLDIGWARTDERAEPAHAHATLIHRTGSRHAHSAIRK